MRCTVPPVAGLLPATVPATEFAVPLTAEPTLLPALETVLPRVPVVCCAAPLAPLNAELPLEPAPPIGPA